MVANRFFIDLPEGIKNIKRGHMPRISIEIPDKVHYETKIKVRITDLNYGDHLGHDRLISLIHEARMEFFVNLGYTEMNIEGIGILIADLAAIYKEEVFYGEELKFEICVGEFSKYGCDIFYRITSMATMKTAALAKTGIVFKKKGASVLSPPPEKFASHFRES